MLYLYFFLSFHITGAAALYLQANPSMTPDQVWAQMLSDATLDIVEDPGRRSPNTFLFVN